MIKNYLEALIWSELIEQSMDWNENALPDNTIDMQYIKVAEETKIYNTQNNPSQHQ